MDRKEYILRKLEEELKALPNESLPPLPSLKEDDFRAASTRWDILNEYITPSVLELLSSISSPMPFRICSIGCGTAAVDFLLLSGLAKQFPSLKVQYVGVDIDEGACSIARKNLNCLDFAESKILCQDISEGLEEKKFHFILSASSFYYFKSPESVLELCKSLIVPKGLMIICVSEKSTLDLFSLFWTRQFEYDVCFSPKIHSILKTKGIVFSEKICHYKCNIGEYLQNEFATDSGKQALTMYTQVDTHKYPASIFELCVRYMETIAKDAPDSGEKFISSKTSFFYLYF